MSEPHLSQDATLPSIQHTDTERTPLPTLITHSTPAISNHTAFTLSGAQSSEDDHSYVMNELVGRDPSLGQADLAGPPESRVVHGKVACQACVSRINVRWRDI